MDPAGPKPCAGMPGTTMLVEDMFYNVPARQKAIRTGSEEHARILDMVGRYAIFATAVGITVKRHGEARPDLHTTAGAGQLDAIRRAACGTVLHGVPIVRHCPCASPYYHHLEYAARITQRHIHMPTPDVRT